MTTEILYIGFGGTANTASPLFTVAAAKLAANGDYVEVEWDETISAGNIDSNLDVNAVAKTAGYHGNVCGGHHSIVRLVRTSTTNLSTSWMMNDGSAANGAFSHQDITVSSLDTNSFTLQIPANAARTVRGYKVTVFKA